MKIKLLLHSLTLCVLWAHTHITEINNGSLNRLQELRLERFKQELEKKQQEMKHTIEYFISDKQQRIQDYKKKLLKENKHTAINALTIEKTYEKVIDEKNYYIQVIKGTTEKKRYRSRSIDQNYYTMSLLDEQKTLLAYFEFYLTTFDINEEVYVLENFFRFYTDEIPNVVCDITKLKIELSSPQVCFATITFLGFEGIETDETMYFIRFYLKK